MNIPPAEILSQARALSNWIVEHRRTIHRHPELGYKEYETSRLVQSTLDQLEIPYETPIAETGVVARIGSGDSPCVALRADMDALPMTEEANVPFKSETEGVMHACGHDGHTAMLLGAAALLKKYEPEISGTVKLLFQPAEEGGAGAKRMIEEGVLDNPPVERIFGLHVWPAIPSGTIGGTAGAFLAAAGQINIRVIGVGGHAAMPHLTVDPVTCAAKIIVELQTLISREQNPLDPGVVSITHINGGGYANNIIPPDVEMGGTIRCFDMESMARFQKRITDVTTHIANANRCTAEVSFPGNDYPPTVNDRHSFELICTIAEELLGSGSARILPPVMGGEDFAYFLQKVPGCIVGLGIRNSEVGSIHNLHHPGFIVDEDALPIGAALHANFALRTLNELSS